MRGTIALALAIGALSAPSAQAAAPIEWYRQPNGFEAPNPWGRYTAYLLSTNERGQRTWRIENFLPQGAASQGSTMWLFEGSRKALLVDTAQNTVDVPIVAGKPDLAAVVDRLLGTNNDGTPRTPVDWVVAISHGHGDHTGKVAALAPRTIYYPDLDWPANATPNIRPVKEGGGV